MEGELQFVQKVYKITYIKESSGLQVRVQGQKKEKVRSLLRELEFARRAYPIPLIT